MASKRQFALYTFIALLTALTGCVRQTVGPGSEPPVHDDRIVEVNLSVVGGPLTEAGAVERGDGQLVVTNSAGELLQFNENAVVDEEGEQGVLTITESEASFPVYLYVGDTFTFEANTYDGLDNLLAHGTGTRTTVDVGSNATTVHLTALMGTVSLHPRFPIRQLLPGQVVDFTLNVNANKRPDLRLALSDIDTSYEVNNGTLITESNRGVQVRVGDRASGDLIVGVTANGLVASNGSSEAGHLTDQVVVPFSSEITVDLTNPTVGTLAFDSVQQILTGIADDDFGIAGLDVYDGPKHLATTDIERASLHGLSAIEFPGGGTAFISHLALGVGTFELTVIATDTSGNHAEANLTITVQ